MDPSFRGSSTRGDLAALLLLFAAITAAIGLLLSPQLYDLHTPIGYWRDGLSHAFIIKTIIDVGWYPVHTPWVGAPFGSDLFDYPFSDGLNFLLIRLLAWSSSDWVVVQKLFYLGAYFLSGAAAFVVMRKLGVAAAFAACGALLFVLLPYHWMRPWHLLLGSYAVVTLGIWLAYVAWRGTARIPSWRSLAANGVIAVAVGSGGAYYAFFSAFLVAVAGLCRALATRSLRQALPAILITACIGTTVALNVAPTLWYRVVHGPNPEIAERSAADSENYGLRLTQMVLPHLVHRIPAFDQAARRYAGSAPMINENITASLGVFGVAGLALLAIVILRRLGGAIPDNDVLAFLAMVVLACFMLGTIGGIGSLFAYGVSPMIRAYNRISIYIGFASLAGLLLVLQQWIGHAARKRQAPITIAVAIVVALAGALDLTPTSYPSPPPNVGNFASDRAFVHAAESRLPPGTMVWQLPYQPFPESRPGDGPLEVYGHFRGYLNSKTLRWSYGAMRGRDADTWLRALSAGPLRQAIGLAEQSGFGAVYIDRRGYDDRGVAIEKVLREKLGEPIVQSDDRALAIWRLPNPGSGPLPLDALLAPIDTPIRFDAPVMTTLVKALSGIAAFEPWGRWTEGPVARIELARQLPLHFTLKISTEHAMEASAGTTLGVRIGGVQKDFSVARNASSVEIPFTLTESASSIEIEIPHPVSPRDLGINNDPRQLGIGLKSITILPTASAG